MARKYSMQKKHISVGKKLVCTYLGGYTSNLRVGDLYTLNITYDASKRMTGSPNAENLYNLVEMRNSYNLSKSDWVTFLGISLTPSDIPQFIPEELLTEEDIFTLRLSGNSDFLINEEVK